MTLTGGRQIIDFIIVPSMLSLTPIPQRNIARFNRLVAQQRDSEPDLAILQLISRLQLEFEKDEQKLSSQLLHYKDIVIKDTQHVDQRVHFSLPNSSPDSNGPQRKKVYPPTPVKPSMEMLKKLLEISYSEYSTSSFEDTSADSKLAEWLASFAKESTNRGGPSVEDSVRMKTYTKWDGKGDSDASPGRTPWRPYANSYPSNPGLLGRKRSLSDSSDFYHTHSSETASFPSPESPSAGRRVRLQLSPLEIPSQRDGSVGTNETPFTPTLGVKLLQEPDTPIIDSPTTPNTVFRRLSLQLDSPSPHLRQSPDLSHFLNLSGTANNSLNDAADISRSFNKSKADSPPNRSISPLLPDLSSIHAFNLSLQHASKSPFLIRTWRRMLGELTGRFPLGFSRDKSEGILDAESLLLEEKVDPSGNVGQDDIRDEGVPNESSLRDGALNRLKLLADPDQLTTTTVTKTHADALLDREYATYLRKGIDARIGEVRMLEDLLEQRKGMIEKMERVLRMRAIEALVH